MIGKIKNYDEALDAIEIIDEELSNSLSSSDKYGEMMKLMEKRLVYISEILRLKDNSEPSELIKTRIKKIFDSANSIQEKVRNKRDKIKARLDKNQKLEIRNKNINY